MSLMDPVWVIVDGIPISLNQSRIQTYQRCHRKYGWFHIENLIPDRPTYALELGSAVHTALAEYRGGKINVEDATKIAIKDFIRRMPAKKMPGDDELIAEQVETINHMLPAYFDRYAHEPDPWVPIGIEVAGKIEVGTGTNIFIVFRIDELATWHKNLWIVDHKTAKKLDPRDMLKYEMDIQISTYTYAASKLLGRRVTGAIIDVLVKTKVPQFHRELFTRSPDELKEFEDEFIEVARELKARHLRVQQGEPWKTVFYKTTSECFAYGTCWFRDLCVRDNETRRMAFKTRPEDYVDNPKLLEKPKEEEK